MAIATSELNDDIARGLFWDGYCEMLRRCQPVTLLIYGTTFKHILEAQASKYGTRVKRYHTRLTEQLIKQKHQGQLELPLEFLTSSQSQPF